ncbi:MAG: hypothetical protein M1816_007607 [Peltula sp. TS41687]|nr:MAG: hypothetical protein M1816_007607 [Peltula sp. TS41687]
MAQNPAGSAWADELPDQPVPMLDGHTNGSSSHSEELGLASKPPRPEDDPFYSPSPPSNHYSRRFANFDSQRFDISPSTSPAQAKRALEAHLAETNKRIQDASKLGTNLVQQRENLSKRLKEVEQQQADREIGPELRQKLIDFEAEYNEVVRESARAFLGPRSRLAQAEDGSRGADSQHPTGPALYSSQATASPSKMNAPSRRHRNQPTNQIRDLQFATDIGTSLLIQVRDLQGVVAERDEAIRNANLEKSKLEVELEGLKQRVRNLDESEQRYKDENWNLETQTHELMAAAREAADREQRLGQSLNVVNAEKETALRELDEMKQAHGKLTEDHSHLLKHHELELSSLRRSISTSENENGISQRKIQDLTSQNQELAKALAGRMGHEELRPFRESDDDDEDLVAENFTPEHSPPPSPTKGTPRHNMLESETLKSSLHHAHRMIQNLKGNIHREKTEKIELKRMLQDARDELDMRRSEGGRGNVASNANKRRKAASDKGIFKKPAGPNLLGTGRQSQSEIQMEEPGWEDHTGEDSMYDRTVFPPGVSYPQGTTQKTRPVSTSAETVEGSDVFETADERGGTATETEAFQTGAESLAGDSSDEETETEDGMARVGTIRGRPSLALNMARAGQRESYMSTASTSGDEETARGPRTPLQPQQRYRMRITRGAAAHRHSKSGSEAGLLGSYPNGMKDSPASFVSNNSVETTNNDQTLLAELGDFDAVGTEDGESVSSTPNRPGLGSRASTSASMIGSVKRSPAPPSLIPPLPKPVMTDASTMTELEPSLIRHLADVGTMTEPEISIATPPGVNFKTAKDLNLGFANGDTTVERDTEPVENTRFAKGLESSPISRLADIGTMTEPELFLSPPKVNSTTAKDLDLNLAVGATTVVMDSEPVESTGLVEGVEPTATSTLEETSNEQPRTEEIGEIKRSVAVPTLQQQPVLVESDSFYDSVEVPSTPKPADISLAISPILVAEVESDPMVPQLDKTPTHEQLDDYAEEDDTTANEYIKSLSPTMPLPELLAISPIIVQETVPITSALPIVDRDAQLKRGGASSVLNLAPDSIKSPPVRTEVAKPGSSKAGLYTSVSAWATSPTSISEKMLEYEPIESRRDHRDRRDLDPRSPFDAESPFKARSDTTIHGHGIGNREVDATFKVPEIGKTDRASPTVISSDQLQNLFSGKDMRFAMNGVGQEVKAAPSSPTRRGSGHSQSSRYSYRTQETHPNIGRARTRSNEAQEAARDDPLPAKTVKSPNSSGSIRSSYSTHPPLPSDHKQAIAAAQRGSVPEPSQGLMGPPLAPASAYKNNTVQFKHRGPSTPIPGAKAGTTPRPRQSATRSDVSSAMTRRSSVSSFASELNERFNIRADGMAMPYAFEGPGADPQMIQAITQTMIGEYMWKYTRKAGRVEMSKDRHRRFFWVHPYTRTLYWSDRNPAGGGRAELKAKSVAIEAVRVVSDDNPMPPGLHRKSLVVITPGRTIQFTAATSQRHTTWFNALSYLLLRTGAENGGQGYDEALNQNLTSEDADEFNPASHGQRRTGLSFLSHRTSIANMSPMRNQSRTTIRSDAQMSGAAGVAGTSSSRVSKSARHGSISRLSQIFRPGSALSFSSRRGRHSAAAAQSSNVYNSNISDAHDSAEDVREVMDRQEKEAARLENVRACCDGKHDVGTLTKRGSHAGRHSHHLSGHAHGYNHEHDHPHREHE